MLFLIEIGIFVDMFAREKAIFSTMIIKKCVFKTKISNKKHDYHQKMIFVENSNFQKLVKEIYERFSVISSKQVRLVSYAEHFIPFTIQWLDDCSIEYCKYVEKSYYIDEEEKFARDNEYVKFRVVFCVGGI